MYRELINNRTIINLAQNGNMVEHARTTLLIRFEMNNLQPTGIYGIPGERITIYAEIENTNYMPTVVFTQNQGSYRNWNKRIVLRPGKNEIIVPEISREDYEREVKIGGAIYIENPYEEVQQGKEPRVIIEGGRKYPYYKKDDNVEAFKSFLIDYNNKLKEDNKNGTNLILDMAEIEASRMLLSVTATGAYETYIVNKVSPQDTVIFWDETMLEVFKFHGLDSSSFKNDPKSIRENIRFMQPLGFMYAHHNHIGIQKNEATNVLNPNNVINGSWGYIHEIGHKFETKYSYSEVTNNVLSLHMTDVYGRFESRICYEDGVYSRVAPDKRNYNGSFGSEYFVDLGALWQLQMFDREFWPRINKLHRAENNYGICNATPTNKADCLLGEASKVLNLDLGEYFLRYGLRLSGNELESVSEKYKKLDKKLWYLNDTAYKYNGEPLPANSEVILDIDFVEDILKRTTISFQSNIPLDRLLGYEILRNNEVIGFTMKNMFVDKNPRNPNKKYEYKIIAYGKDLSKSKESNILIIGEDVDHNLSKVIDLTDLPAKYVKQSYGFPKLDLSIGDKKLSLTDENGNIVEYSRGIGAHSISEIIYDLSKDDYEVFTSYIGMDREIFNTSGSVVFEVYVDNIKKYASGIMYANDSQKFIKIDIKGANELKLVVKDAEKGNVYDHADWCKPQLHLPEDIIIEGELAKFVKIEDNFLRDQIKKILKIKSDNITIAQMHKLTKLVLEVGYVKSLKGLEHAINLRELKMDFNEIKDLSPLKNLQNLQNFTGIENYYMEPGELGTIYGEFIIDDNAIDITGEELLPKEIILSTSTGYKSLERESVLKDGKIVIDSELLGDKYKSTIEIFYESKVSSFSVYVFRFLTKKPDLQKEARI